MLRLLTALMVCLLPMMAHAGICYDRDTVQRTQEAQKQTLVFAGILDTESGAPDRIELWQGEDGAFSIYAIPAEFEGGMICPVANGTGLVKDYSGWTGLASNGQEIVQVAFKITGSTFTIVLTEDGKDRVWRTGEVVGN